MTHKKAGRSGHALGFSARSKGMGWTVVRCRPVPEAGGIRNSLSLPGVAGFLFVFRAFLRGQFPPTGGSPTASWILGFLINPGDCRLRHRRRRGSGRRGQAETRQVGHRFAAGSGDLQHDPIGRLPRKHCRAASRPPCVFCVPLRLRFTSPRSVARPHSCPFVRFVVQLSVRAFAVRQF